LPFIIILLLSVIDTRDPHPGAYFEQWLSQMRERPAFFKNGKTTPYGSFPCPDMHGQGEAGRRAAPGAIGSGQAFENFQRGRLFPRLK